jgi:selenocysteine lyase/cysteine desulfurase
MTYLGVPSGLTRVSFHVYNDEKDVNEVFRALEKVKEIFGK